MVAVTLVALGGAASADLITPTGVTASSQLAAGYEAVNTINGNGLNAPGDETATHVAGSGSGTMWLTSNVTDSAIGAFITFDLGGEYDLTGAWIWTTTRTTNPGGAS